MDRTLHTFQEIDPHQAAYSYLTPCLQAFGFLFIQIFMDPACQDVCQGRIDREVKIAENFKHFPIVDRTFQRSKFRTEGYGFVSIREVSDVGYVIVGLDMPARPGNRHAIQNLEKVKIESFQQGLCRALCFRKLAPGVIRLLRLPEDRVYIRLCIQLFIPLCRISFIGKCQLIAQIKKAVIDRCCR